MQMAPNEPGHVTQPPCVRWSFPPSGLSTNLEHRDDHVRLAGLDGDGAEGGERWRMFSISVGSSFTHVVVHHLAQTRIWSPVSEASSSSEILHLNQVFDASCYLLYFLLLPVTSCYFL